MVYLAGSKLSVAVLGNLGFAVALSLYKLITLVRRHGQHCLQSTLPCLVIQGTHPPPSLPADVPGPVARL